MEIELARNVGQERGVGMEHDAGLTDCHQKTFQERPLSFRGINEWRDMQRLPSESRAQAK